MSSFSRNKKSRLRDFTKRFNKRDDVYFHEIIKHQYVTHHPFADDVELLNKLKMTPVNCKSVDGYWHMGSDISFIQISVYEGSVKKFWMRWPKEKGYLLNFNIVVDEKYITQDLFEKIMLKIWTKGIRPNIKLKRKLTDRLIAF